MIYLEVSQKNTSSRVEGSAEFANVAPRIFTKLLRDRQGKEKGPKPKQPDFSCGFPTEGGRTKPTSPNVASYSDCLPPLRRKGKPAMRSHAWQAFS